MFLRTLTLKGFKSFAEATTLELEPGITVVVGPNGSGKSNVVDAIAWVLGAQAPSAVRSQKMDDVIFAGTASKPALGRAEVELTIDNSAGLLPIDFTEVTVSRTLWRTGESEYAVNGVPCRLLDIQELLSDSGVGRQQHVIVSQGQIDGVLNARAEERRAIVEEAAGVLKYRKRKERAERRLEATEANLVRVQDLLREVRRQLRPLERQAEAARRHGDLVTELRALRIFLIGREISGYQARIAALSGELATHARTEADLKSRLAHLDTEVLAAEARLSAHGALDLGDALMRVEQLRERAKGLAGVLAERRRSLERDRGALLADDVLANLEAEAAGLRAQLEEVEREALALDPAADELASREAELAEARRSLDGSWTGAVTASSTAAAEARGELAALRTSVERGLDDAMRAANQARLYAERATRLDADAARRREECDEAQAAEVVVVADLQRAEAVRSAAEHALENAETTHRSLVTEFSGWEARADALALALEEAGARAGVARLAGVDGVLGTLLDLVEIDDGWEAAFEAAAGEALVAVVVRDRDAARRALRALHDGDASGAVLALGGLTSPSSPHAFGSDSVRAHVRGRDARVDVLLDHLVGAAVVVEGGWEAALDEAAARADIVAVTRSGDRFAAEGWRLGAPRAGATAAALEQARGRAAIAAAAVERASADLDRARSSLQAARAADAELARTLDTTDARFTAAADSLQRVLAERRDVEIELEALTRSTAEIDSRLERERRRISELDAILPGLEADEGAEAEHARALQAARARVDELEARLAATRTDHEVRSATVNERRQFLAHRLTELEERLAADASERALASERRTRVERALTAVDRLHGVVAGHMTTLDAHLAELLGERQRQTDAARAVAEALDQLRRARTDAERSLEETRERSRRSELEEAEVKMRLEQALHTVRAELDTEPDVAMVAELPALPEGTNAAARVRELDRELRLMGPINPLALEEFNALQERHTFLETQLEDVRSSRRDLQRVISAIDGEIQSVFAGAFADVSVNFEQLFATLFPGGTGKLVLTDPDNLLDTGIEVEAKPSGKNVKKLSLLSGGERSLTALAFLFAVFRSRPSPFYVMDEVEAALDDVNLHRFLALLSEFREEAQLIVVSHQKRTMEAADCLLGITMQSGGSSKVISERVSADV
jgi:chromosome segregation protein